MYEKIIAYKKLVTGAFNINYSPLLAVYNPSNFWCEPVCGKILSRFAEIL